MATETRPQCRLCGVRAHWLGTHLTTAHDRTIASYLRDYPNAPLASEALARRVEVECLEERRHPPAPLDLTVTFAGIKTPVNPDVPLEACLPLPDHYRIPEHGDLAKDVAEVAVYLRKRRSTYISGPQGTGKDALPHAWSHMTRTPGLMFQVEPGADIRAWFFSHEFNKDGTFWQEGELIKALRDGYLTKTGRRIPYLILITDFDRATKEQAESLRLVLDSISGRVKGPGGVTYDVLPGTLIVVTANTTGGGDATGRYISANVIDSSIMDRFDRAIKFHMLSWKDEEVILKNKFPLLVSRCPAAFVQVGNATDAMRKAIEKKSVYAEFSHRAVCAWLGAAVDILETQESSDIPADLLQRAFRAVADKMPDAQTAVEVTNIVGQRIVGGLAPK